MDPRGYMREIEELNDRLAHMREERDRLAAELAEVLEYAGHQKDCPPRITAGQMGRLHLRLDRDA